MDFLEKNMSFPSEYHPLKEVLLYVPDKGIKVNEPGASLFVRPVDFLEANKELEGLISVLEGLGIRVHRLNDEGLCCEDKATLSNMMYVRDLFFMTPLGAVVSRMRFSARQKETLSLVEKLKELRIPILMTIAGESTFEGADALWLNETTVMLGVGKRTNRQGAQQVKEALAFFGVRVIPVPFAQELPQHLLGVVQIIAEDIAVIREQRIDPQISAVLNDLGFQVIPVKESLEVEEWQALNFLTIAPRKIIMPANCPETQEILTRAGVDVLDTVSIPQVINGGGGIACAVGIMRRESI